MHTREKWIGIESKDLGESSGERNRKFTLTKGAKKRRRQRAQEKERSLIGINQENITLGGRKYSPFSKSDFTSPQVLKSLPLFASEPYGTRFLK